MINPYHIDMSSAGPALFPVGMLVMFRCLPEGGLWVIDDHIATEIFIDGRKFWRYRIRQHSEVMDNIREDSLIGAVVQPDIKRQLFKLVA